ncbi:MAG: hypothetical protein KAY65_06290 [Planctomycetes bacterium]|nr:hypothetical protein [Planctomycetota bacterium]
MLRAILCNTSGKAVTLKRMPDLFRLELDGQWYQCSTGKEQGQWSLPSGMAIASDQLSLDGRWLSVGDDVALKLTPGRHTLRAKLNATAESERTGLVVSKPIQFEVIATD